MPGQHVESVANHIEVAVVNKLLQEGTLKTKDDLFWVSGRKAGLSRAKRRKHPSARVPGRLHVERGQGSQPATAPRQPGLSRWPSIRLLSTDWIGSIKGTTYGTVKVTMT